MSDKEQSQPSLLHFDPSTIPLPDEELAETVRQAFEEINSSSFRIAKSLKRLNSLAQETYCELDATRRILSLRNNANQHGIG